MSRENSGHAHSHRLTMKTLRLAFFLTLIILAAQVIGGILAHSLALLSDGGHALTDIFALGLAWFATAQAERPADARKTFGYHRVGILAALVNAITLILIALGILVEAAQRFQHPQPVQPLVMFVSASIGIAINLFIGFGLHKAGSTLNTRAAALHVFGDVGASVGVIVAGLVILFTGWTPADSLLSVGIAGLIAVGAWQIVRETMDILLEAVPQGINMPALVEDMTSVIGVDDVHDLHVWSISSGMAALSCHALINDLSTSESATIRCALETLLSSKYQIDHSTIQFECHAHEKTFCSSRELYCQMEVRAEQSAHRGHTHPHTHLHRSGAAHLAGECGSAEQNGQ